MEPPLLSSGQAAAHRKHRNTHIGNSIHAFGGTSCGNPMFSMCLLCGSILSLLYSDSHYFIIERQRLCLIFQQLCNIVKRISVI